MRKQKPFIDHYETLGIKDKSYMATPEEIKKAYRELAKKYHPDKVPGYINKMQGINNAYEVLSDEKLRKDFDRKRKHHMIYHRNKHKRSPIYENASIYNEKSYKPHYETEGPYIPHEVLNLYKKVLQFKKINEKLVDQIVEKGTSIDLGNLVSRIIWHFCKNLIQEAKDYKSSRDQNLNEIDRLGKKYNVNVKSYIQDILKISFIDLTQNAILYSSLMEQNLNKIIAYGAKYKIDITAYKDYILKDYLSKLQENAISSYSFLEYQVTDIIKIGRKYDFDITEYKNAVFKYWFNKWKQEAMETYNTSIRKQKLKKIKKMSKKYNIEIA